MGTSIRFKQLKWWAECKIRKLFNLPNEPIVLVLTKRIISYPPASSFPTDVLKYIKKNATPRQALKIMKACKYFCYQKFPFYSVKYVNGNRSRWILHSFPEKNLQYFDKIENVPPNLWITEWLEIFNETEAISDLFPKIAYCECSSLILKNQILTFDDYVMLTIAGKVDYLYFYNTRIKFDNGELVPFERLIETLKNFITLCDPPANFNYSIFFHFIEIITNISYTIELSIPHSVNTLIQLQKHVNKLMNSKRKVIMNLDEDFEQSLMLFILVAAK
uniref:Uncharacterized protein n=1 Tax=Panagrolaimus sp. PS1159 TaxID=55785 RepID=A0AC35GWG7_9BILA